MNESKCVAKFTYHNDIRVYLNKHTRVVQANELFRFAYSLFISTAACSQPLIIVEMVLCADKAALLDENISIKF